MMSPLELELQMEMRQKDVERSTKQKGVLVTQVPFIDVIFGIGSLSAAIVM